MCLVLFNILYISAISGLPVDPVHIILSCLAQKRKYYMNFGPLSEKGATFRAVHFWHKKLEAV